MPISIELQMETYIHLSKYSRYLDNKKRREDWEESCKRWATFWADLCPEVGDVEIEEVASIAGQPFDQGIIFRNDEHALDDAQQGA